MATASIEIDRPETVADLSRYLELLDHVGIPTDGEQPVKISVSGTISTSLHLGDLVLPSDIAGGE